MEGEALSLDSGTSRPCRRHKHEEGGLAHAQLGRSVHAGHGIRGADRLCPGTDALRSFGDPAELDTVATDMLGDEHVTVVVMTIVVWSE